MGKRSYLSATLVLLVLTLHLSLGCGGGTNSNGTSNPAALTPVASISPTSLMFGGQNTNSQSAAQPLTLSNTGTASLAINGISVSGDFRQTNNCGASIAANGNCTIQVTFNPTTSGTRLGAVTIQSSFSNSPQMANLVGTGTSAAASVPGTPTGTTSVTITGTNGGASSQLPFGLTVQ